MSYLLDTNVVSELVRPRPSARVVSWVEDQPPEALHLSVLTLGEIRTGIERLVDRRRRERLRSWLEQELPAWFEGRLLPPYVITEAEIAEGLGLLEAAIADALGGAHG